MKIWLLRIEHQGQLVQEIGFDTFTQANEYIVKDKKLRYNMAEKMSYFLQHENI